MPIYPISFSIPESKIIQVLPTKTKTTAHIVPGDKSTYLYTNEDDYYKDYQSSLFGKTCKKAGWDCLRHYEILANGCIPMFEDIDKIPTQTMYHFPKYLLQDVYKSPFPDLYIPVLLNYTRKHLTCRAMAQYILDTIGQPNAKRVLYLSSSSIPDYLRCLTLIGFKQLLGTNCIDFIHIPHIYEDYSCPESLYGNGFTYTRILPISLKTPPLEVSDIQNGSFDVIVYGSFHRGMSYWDEVRSVYPSNKIVMLCGEDLDPQSMIHDCIGHQFAKEGYHVFIREL